MYSRHLELNQKLNQDLKLIEEKPTDWKIVKEPIDERKLRELRS